MMLRIIRYRLLLSIFILSLLSAIYYSYQLWHIQQLNRDIVALLAGDARMLDSNAPPELLLAQAHYLKQHHRYDEALTALSRIVEQGAPKLQLKARYNLGNIYLEQAITAIEAGRHNTAIPLVGLAKQAYRQALRLDSEYWDAKYNLDVAMRLLPELEKLNLDQESDAAPKTQLWTTVPGFPRGLP